MINVSTLKVKVDAKGAQKGAAKVETAFDRMASNSIKSLNRMSRKLDQLNRFLTRMNPRLMGEVNSAGRAFNATFRGMGTVAVGSIQAVTSVVGGLRKNLISSRTAVVSFFAAIGAGYVLNKFLHRLIQVNTAFNAFIATMNVMTGSVQASTEEYEYLLQFSNKMGTNLESVTKQYGRLAASLKMIDKEGKITRHIFEGISQAATVLHLKGHETNLLFMALEQAASKGKVSLEEFQRQLSNTLPGAMSLASRAMDMTQAEFRDKVRRGTLDVYEVLIKLANQIKIEYAKSAAYAAEQFTGRLNAMKNSVFQLYRVIGQNGAMDGLTSIVKVMTEKLGSDSIGETLGPSLEKLFNQIASWIDDLTTSDIQEFFLGLSGIVQSFTILMSEMVKAIGKTTDGEADFITFGEVVSKAMIITADAVGTLISALAMIPLSINAAIADIQALGAWMEYSKDIIVNPDIASEKLDRALLERQQAVDLANASISATLGLSDSATSIAWDKTDAVFADLRKQRKDNLVNSKVSKPVVEYNTGPMTDVQIEQMLKNAPGAIDPMKDKAAAAFDREELRLARLMANAEREYQNLLDGRLKIENKLQKELEIKFKLDAKYMSMTDAQKGILRVAAEAADEAIKKRTALQKKQSDATKAQAIADRVLSSYQKELADLTKRANVANLESQNIMDGQLRSQGKQRAELEVRLKVEKDFIALTGAQKQILLEAADAADKANASRLAARQYQSDLLAINRKMFTAEQQLLDLQRGANPVASANLRAFEEKLKFDSEYLAMSDEMIKTERQKAIAADKLAVSIQSVSAAMAYRNDTIIQSLQITRQTQALSNGDYASKYNEANSIRDSFTPGGANQFLAEADKNTMLDSAKTRDSTARARDQAQLKFDAKSRAESLRFELQLQGKTSREIEKATEFRNIEMQIKELSAGASKEELAAYKDLELFLKDSVSNTLDELYEKQNSLTQGMKNGLSSYLSGLQDVSSQVSDVIRASFGALENFLTDFITKGKFNFSDFVGLVIRELVKLTIRLLIIKPLIEALTGFASGGAGGGAAESASSASASFSAPSVYAADGAVFDGGVKRFAKGGAFSNSIVNQSTTFPLGMMGEAGPEAIMPLSRDSRGRLGVNISTDSEKATVNNQVTIAVNIESGEVKDDQASGNELGNRLKTAVLTVLTDELRPGGILAKV